MACHVDIIIVCQDSEIKASAAQYLPEISEILNTVPREMLLILKASDLLRGIETTLQTRANASSFLTMSKCCVRAVANYRRRLSHSWAGRLRLTVQEHWTLFTISMYEFYLWLRGTTLVNRILGVEVNTNGTLEGNSITQVIRSS